MSREDKEQYITEMADNLSRDQALELLGIIYHTFGANGGLAEMPNGTAVNLSKLSDPAIEAIYKRFRRWFVPRAMRRKK